jgi:regulator of replication initiation timing
MALTDIFVTDPIVKRARRLADIEREQIKVYTQIKQLRREAADLKGEYERVRLECKQLKKFGRVGK